MSTPEPDPLRLGLIGAGHWGKAYIRTLGKMPGLELARLCTSNPESRQLVPAGCRITRNWEDVATADDIDGVIVATPPSLHAEMTKRALESGLPVMVEKPLTLSLDEALELEKTAAGCGLPVLVDHIHLFHPAYVEMKRLTKDLGPPRHIRSEGGNWGPFREDTTAMWDYAPHDLSLCIDLMNAHPSSIEAERVALQKTGETAGEIVQIHLNFPVETTSEITVGKLMQNKRRWLAAWFDTCVFVFDDQAEEKLIRHDAHKTDFFQGPPAGEGVPVPFDYSPPLDCALAVFADALRGGADERIGVALGVEIVRILSQCEAILDS